jgi:hypothetical protein
MAEKIDVRDAVGAVVSVGADEVPTGGGIWIPREKVGFGADGAYQDVDATHPLPVVQTGASTLPAGASTETTLAAAAAALANILTQITAVNANTDAVEGPLGTMVTSLGNILTQMTAVNANTDTLETLITALNGYVDGLEGVLGTAADAAVITNANGTHTAFLRGLVTMTAARAMNTGVADANTQRVTIATNDAVATAVAELLATGQLNANSGALANSLVIKNAAGRLYGLQGINTLAGAQWIHFFDAAAVPADATVPLISIPVAGGAQFSIDFGIRGRTFANGIVVTNSTAAAAKTLGAANCLFDAQYK